MKSMFSDQELLAAFSNGDNSAMDILITRYHSKVLGYLRHLVRNRELAEDLCQETFMKVIRSLKQDAYHDDGHFSAWLFRIAHNLMIDYFRKENKLPTVSNDNGEIDLFNNAKFSDATIEMQSIKSQINSDLKDLIRELPEEQRNTVLMRVNLDMSFKEIAESQGISINTALGRMRYAIINLRKMIEERNLTMTYIS
ncbi:MAG: sigma-70 family RNA polymerase sigma factor [Bacteroidales bacterium]|nr:sigma-70 family RNA polymerase sigma factor [Bacteroidales bacterium]